MKQIETNQNFYHLSCIQIVATGFPVIIIGKQLSSEFGAGTAITSILIGNLLLWLIGLAIISMVYQEKTNAIENVKGYVGKYGGLIFAIILILAFLDWYVIQINKSITGLRTLFQYSYPWKKDIIIRIGAGIGLVTALLSIGGIRLLRWLTVIFFPFFVLYNIYVIGISSKTIFSDISWYPTIPGIIITILVLLPGVINLPTFFRHSRSRANSFLALTLMFIFISFFECSAIWMNFSPESNFILENSGPPNFYYFIIPTTLFLVISAISSNLLNIYLASACYEAFIKRFSGNKGHAIMGLLGTAMYTFVQISAPVKFIENLLNCYIAVVGVVLVVAVLSRIIVQHRPRKFEKTINAISWAIGSIVASIFQIQTPFDGITPLLYGIGTSALFFLIVFFIEETVWSIQKLHKKDEENIANE